MTCPTCSRPNRDFVNSSGLLTRCDDPWHIGRDFLAETLATTPLPRHWLAEAACPARPDDFATQTPPAPHFPPPSHHGAAKAVADASQDSLPVPDVHIAVGPEAVAEVLASPYTTPIPEPTTNGANGWIYCNACDAPQPTSGHECGRTSANLAFERDAMSAVAQFERSRAEFAESLLCAEVFAHSLAAHIGGEDCGQCRCVLCNAARGGGR